MVLAALAGCNQPEAGTPTPVTGGASANETSRPGPRTTTSPSTPSQAKIDACSLLSDSDAAGFGLPAPGVARSISGNPGCSWTASGKVQVSVAIDNKGIAGLSGEAISLPKHKATQVRNAGGTGGCGIAIEMSDASSSAFVIVVPIGNTPDDACSQAVEVAKVVDSKLP
ncbi:DUF3558 domain-containing protein [Kibdelosporangium aridum]|uniref:DUF3558 domain-containing protein n=1 Tax=Kibdelosporangium aridum TaxID=2030 RepID=UPI0035E6271F